MASVTGGSTAIRLGSLVVVATLGPSTAERISSFGAAIAKELRAKQKQQYPNNQKLAYGAPWVVTSRRWVHVVLLVCCCWQYGRRLFVGTCTAECDALWVVTRRLLPSRLILNSRSPGAAGPFLVFESVYQPC